MAPAVLLTLGAVVGRAGAQLQREQDVSRCGPQSLCTVISHCPSVLKLVFKVPLSHRD